MNLNERIAKVLQYSEKSPSEFAELIDVQRSSISHITSGRNKPSLDFLIKVKEQFPDISWDWLINGEGKMLMDKESEAVAETVSKETPLSLPDLFSLIDDDNFGREEKTAHPASRESNILSVPSRGTEISDSQPSENFAPGESLPANSDSKIKRIVIFYENGRFESFLP